MWTATTYATGSEGQSARELIVLWDMKNNDYFADAPIRLGALHTSLAFSPDGKYLVANASSWDRAYSPKGSHEKRRRIK